MISARLIRDKRGYESIYLVLEQRRRSRPERRLVYWARRPSVLHVGRELFDDETRAMLERAYPGVTFDWQALLKSENASAAAARYAASRVKPSAAPAPAARAAWREDDEPSELDTIETRDAEPALAGGPGGVANGSASQEASPVGNPLGDAVSATSDQTSP